MPTMKRFLRSVLVFNPASGRGRAAARAQDFAAAFQNRFGTAITLRPTASRQDIRVAASETASEYDLQVFMGGDGTVSHALQGLSELSQFQPLDRPVGLLPAGSGNSFLRDFGLVNYEAARDALLDALQADESMPVDTGLLTFAPPAGARAGQPAHRICFHYWGVGLVCDITAQAMRMRSLGSLNYVVAAICQILMHRMYHLRITVDGVSEDVECNFVSVSNSRFAGGAMMIAPPVRINDGRLFLVIPRLRSRLQMLWAMPKIFRGQHLNLPRVEWRFVSEVKIKQDQPLVFNVDGELESGYNPSISIRPAFWHAYLSPTRLLD